MKKIFIKTRNVRNFIGLVEALKSKPKNIPKMGLIYGEPGLGKSQTALWLAYKYNVTYLRATNLMTGRWLLEELVKELDEIPRYLTTNGKNIIITISVLISIFNIFSIYKAYKGEFFDIPGLNEILNHIPRNLHTKK